MKIDVETKEISVTTRVYTLQVTEEEWEAIKYAVMKGTDTYSSRRALRGVSTPLETLRKLEKDIRNIEDVLSPVRAVEPSEEAEYEDEDDDDDDELLD